MVLSRFYARLMGYYLIIMSVALYFRSEPFHALVTQGPLLLGLGVMGLIFGLAILASHQVWRGWPIIITLIGYWSTIKGLLIIFYPHIIIQMVNSAWEGNHLRIAIGIDLILGIILLVLGHRRTHA